MKPIDIGGLLLLAALWGGSFLFMRIAAPALGPVWLIEVRVLLAGLALLPLLWQLKTPTNLTALIRDRFWPLVLVGCLNSAFPFVLLAYASLALPAGFTSILNATTPLFGTLVAAVWLREKPSWPQLGGLALGFLGVILLVGWQPLINFSAMSAPAPGFGIACVAGLTAAILYAISAPYIKAKLAGVPSIAITSVSLLSAAAVLLPALPFTVPQRLPTPEILLAVITLALASTSLAYILYYRLLQRVGVAKALSVTYLIPAFAMAWGALILQESVTPAMAWGALLILLGTAVVNDLLQTAVKVSVKALNRLNSTVFRKR